MSNRGRNTAAAQVKLLQPSDSGSGASRDNRKEALKGSFAVAPAFIDAVNAYLGKWNIKAGTLTQIQLETERRRKENPRMLDVLTPEQRKALIALAGQLKGRGERLSRAATHHESIALAGHVGSTPEGGSMLDEKAASYAAFFTALKGMVSTKADQAQSGALSARSAAALWPLRRYRPGGLAVRRL